MESNGGRYGKIEREPGGRRRVFDNFETLREMLARRAAGEKLMDLARDYGVDHTTILYHQRRYAVIATTITVSGVDCTAPAPLPRATKTDTRDWNGERINPGRTYAEYIAIQRERENEAFKQRLQARMARQTAHA